MKKKCPEQSKRMKMNNPMYNKKHYDKMMLGLKEYWIKKKGGDANATSRR